MKIDLLLFGQVAEITGRKSMTLEGIKKTDQLMEHLLNRFPALKNVPLAVAVDKMIITENTTLTERSTVAVLPPFSGG